MAKKGTATVANTAPEAAVKTEDMQQYLGADGRWYGTVALARANSAHLSEEELDARYGKAE